MCQCEFSKHNVEKWVSDISAFFTIVVIWVESAERIPLIERKWGKYRKCKRVVVIAATASVQNRSAYMWQ